MLQWLETLLSQAEHGVRKSHLSPYITSANQAGLLGSALNSIAHLVVSGFPDDPHSHCCLCALKSDLTWIHIEGWRGSTQCHVISSLTTSVEGRRREPISWHHSETKPKLVSKHIRMGMPPCRIWIHCISTKMECSWLNYSFLSCCSVQPVKPSVGCLHHLLHWGHLLINHGEAGLTFPAEGLLLEKRKLATSYANLFVSAKGPSLTSMAGT